MGSQLRVCIASHYGISPATYNGLLFEACRALATMTEARLVVPENAPARALGRVASRLRRRMTGLPRHEARPERIEEPCDLFLFVAMCPEDLVNLQAIHGWRENCRRVAVFLFESWSAQAATDAPYYRLLDDVDHVFLFNPSCLPTVRQHTRTPCSYLPAACDVLLATPLPNPGPRPIDVYGMGRIDARVHEQLLEMSAEHRLFYLWEPWGMAMPRDGFPAARARTYHMIRSSRLFTSFNFQAATSKLHLSKGEDAIPARVFEGAAAGAVLVGTAPRLPEFDQLFDWPDAFIELPMDPVDVRAAYEELDRCPDRLRRAGLRNAAQSLRRHDWSYRLEAMLATLDLPVPEGVLKRQARLAALADRAEAQLVGPRVAAG